MRWTIDPEEDEEIALVVVSTVMGANDDDDDDDGDSWGSSETGRGREERSIIIYPDFRDDIFLVLAFFGLVCCWGPNAM